MQQPATNYRPWRALRESNPCFRRERAASWTARRRAQTTRKWRGGKGATYKEDYNGAQSHRMGSDLRSRNLTAHDLFGKPTRLTNAQYWASRSTAPSAAAQRLFAIAQSIVCRASAR